MAGWVLLLLFVLLVAVAPILLVYAAGRIAEKSEQREQR